MLNFMSTHSDSVSILLDGKKKIVDKNWNKIEGRKSKKRKSSKREKKKRRKRKKEKMKNEKENNSKKVYYS